MDREKDRVVKEESQETTEEEYTDVLFTNFPGLEWGTWRNEKIDVNEETTRTG